MSEPRGVLLSGRLAELVMRSVSRDLTVQLRELGKPFPTWAGPVLEALAEASGALLTPDVMSGIRPAFSTIDIEERRAWVSAREAAEQAGITMRHVTRLAKAGKIRAARVGSKTWQIDPVSLKNVLGR